MIPSIDKAIECGVEDRTLRIPGVGIVPSYKGSAYIKQDGKVYHAIGFPAVMANGKLVSNGYIDIQRVKYDTVAKKETQGFSFGRFLRESFAF